MNDNIKFILRDTWIAFPALFIAIYCLLKFTGNITEYFLYPFFGKWTFIVSLPLTWPYIYSPLLDTIMDFFLKVDED